LIVEREEEVDNACGTFQHRFGPLCGLVCSMYGRLES
jgi:hypothetical protein